MIKLSATYLVGKKKITTPVKVPTSWNDITQKKYCELLDLGDGFTEKDIIKRISVLCEIEEENILLLDNSFVERLASMIMFSYDASILAEFNIPPVEYKDFKIGKQKYGAMVKVRQAFKKIRKSKKHDFNLTATLVREYTGEEIEEKPIPEVIGLCNFFLIRSLPSLIDTPHSEIININRKKSKLGLRSLVKRMATFLQSITSQEVVS